MIDAGYVRTMARYNRWQDRNLYDAAGGLTDEARRRDRGAFFGSIHRTLSHLLWADVMWMSRLGGWDRPDVGGDGSADWVADWDDLRARRRAADDRMVDWADGLADADTGGRVAWYSGILKRDTKADRALCLTHMFNHQTHHRGQVHAMLTAAGATPGATDLFVMPDDA